MAATRYNTKACKGCGSVTSALVSATGRTAKHPWRGFCVVSVTEAGRELLLDNGRLIVPCRGCGKERYADRVFGKFVAEKVCSGKCVSATGKVCECNCGGKNHGAGHSI